MKYFDDKLACVGSIRYPDIIRHQQKDKLQVITDFVAFCTPWEEGQL